MIKKHLVANLEAYSSASPDSVAQLIDLDLQAVGTYNDTVALESATVALESVLDAADGLQGKATEDQIHEALAPVAITAIETVDESSANEAKLSMESDDKKAFWAMVKDKVRALWKTIVEYVSRFWEWLKSFFVKSKAANETNKKALDSETDAIIAIISKDDQKTTRTDVNISQSGSIISQSRDITIEATPTWAMQNEGWKVSDVLRRIDHYCKEIIPHAKGIAAQMKEVNRLSKYNLAIMRKRVQDRNDDEIISGWQKAAEQAAASYVSESKFINGTPILIGFTRGPGGYRPCDKAEGEVIFRNVGEIKALSDRLKAYGDASVAAISELAIIDKDVDVLMKEAETFVKGLSTQTGTISEDTLKKIMPLMRKVMFRQIDIVREYAASHGFKSQANGVKLLRAVRLQLEIGK